MKITIFGASGKTGSLLVQQALDQGHHVTAFIRKGGSILLENPKLKIIVGNLNETLKIRDAISGSDACISTLGGSSLRKHAPEIINGIERIIDTMEKENVRRFIYLSSIGAGESRFLIPQPMRFFIVNIMLCVPLADHNANEQNITSSKLNWTIIRPGALSDDPVTQNLRYGIEKKTLKGSNKVSRASVASFILQQINVETFIKKSVWLTE